MCFMCEKITHGGDKQIRTADPLLARQVLYQLSYTPMMPRQNVNAEASFEKLSSSLYYTLERR